MTVKVRSDKKIEFICRTQEELNGVFKLLKEGQSVNISRVGGLLIVIVV